MVLEGRDVGVLVDAVGALAVPSAARVARGVAAVGSGDCWGENITKDVTEFNEN